MASNSIRRVITGHDDLHVARVIGDGPATNGRAARPGVSSTLIWSTDGTPAAIEVGTDIVDRGALALRTQPPANGSRFTVMEFQPGIRSELHRTESLDYIVVVAGEIDMEMDDSTVSLKAGDVMVQRGTNHCWVNHGSEPAVIAVILLDAMPLGIGNPRQH